MVVSVEVEIVPIENSVEAILEKINDFFLKDVDDKFISPAIEGALGSLIDELKSELYCVIEYPYVDKVYRDSYYSYYSSKHYGYQRDCIRVSLFREEVTGEDFLDSERHEWLDELFMGYFVLRPTINALFGRSIIAPYALDKLDYRICKCVTSCLVHGVKLEVEGFPHSSQDGETIKCAETTIWSLMEYFGNKYPEYKPALPAKIHDVLKQFSFQRQLPSNGLTMGQISYALKEFGFGTRVYSFEPYDGEIYDIIDSYIESGIPVILGLESGDIGHAIIAIGKQYPVSISWDELDKTEKGLFGNLEEYFDTVSFPSKYIVQDDNKSPYRIISLDQPGEHYDDEDCSKYSVDSVVVPLYPKIYLEAVIAKELVFQVVKDENVGFDFGADFVFRFYLASSRSFKNHIVKIGDMDQVLKNNILITKMPKFIWIGEFYAKDCFKFSDSKALGIVVLDATEANKESIDALIFAGYPDRCVSLNDNNFVILPQQFENYRYFENLK